MSTQDPLLQLICSLGPKQAAKARRNLSGRKLELFKAMALEKKYLPEDLGKEFKELGDANFAVVKATLLAELTLLFGGADKRESVREQVRDLELKAQVLLAADKVARAISTLEKALAIAREGEDWQEASRVLGLIQLLIDDPESPEELERSATIEEVLTDIQLLRSVLFAARKAKGAAPALMEKRLKALDRVLSSVGRPASHKLGLHYYHVSAFAALFRGDLALALQNLDAAHHCIERCPSMLQDPLAMRSAIAVALSRSSTTLQLRSAVAALEGLQAFLNLLPSKEVRTRPVLQQRILWLELVHAHETQQWESWDELHAALDAALGEGGVLAASRAAVFSAIASMAMARGMARVALRWFERAYNLRKYIEPHKTFQVMGVVYLTAQASLGDWEGMGAHVSRARNMLTRRDMPEGIVRELGLACLGIAREPFMRTKVWQEFLQEIAKSADHQGGNLDFDFLNLRAWTLRQIGEAGDSESNV